MREPNRKETHKYLGKHRGTVINNIDPEQRGRIQAIVPDVFGLTPSSWALPCLPIAGKQMGVHLVPQITAKVWIEFEQGNPDHPIWTGCFWGVVAEVPALAKAGNPASPSIILQTGLQNTFMLSDTPGPTGGILLKTTGLAFISVNDSTGITISDGKGGMINLFNGIVTINQGALLIK